MLLIEKVKLHLSDDSIGSIGWNWKAEELIETLKEKMAEPHLPPRLKQIYLSYTFQLIDHLYMI